jgi:hypothetical protein
MAAQNNPHPPEIPAGHPHPPEIHAGHPHPPGIRAQDEFRSACARGDRDRAQKLATTGHDVRAGENEALRLASRGGHLATVQ